MYGLVSFVSTVVWEVLFHWDGKVIWGRVLRCHAYMLELRSVDSGLWVRTSCLPSEPVSKPERVIAAVMAKGSS